MKNKWQGNEGKKSGKGNANGGERGKGIRKNGRRRMKRFREWIKSQ